MPEKRLHQITLFLVLTLLFCGCIKTTENAENSEDDVFSSGNKSKGVSVVVCRDFGREEIINANYNLSGDVSAMYALESVANVETAYNGGFVNSINGVHSGHSGSQSARMDWFYYINGILANTGSSDYVMYPGDIERWDYHSWGYMFFIPAIVGDYPEPFLHGTYGRTHPTVIVYGSDEFRDDAYEVRDSLIELGVDEATAVSSENLDEFRESSNIILIGYPSNELIAELMSNHKKLGFFAYLEDGKIVVLDSMGEKTYKSEGALVLATQNPWNPKGTGAFENVVFVVSGTEREEIEYAAHILSEKHGLLRNYFGVFIHDEKIMPLPYT